MNLPGLDPVLARALAMAGNPRITSGYRSPEYNSRIGGAPGSMHIQGKAADIDMSGMSDEEKVRLVEVLRANGVRRFGTYDNHPNMLHVDLSDANGPFWQMHDRSNRNMAGAPAWFRGLTPTVDVRMASADSELPPEMQTPGDPRTGQATMNGSPPPEFGDMPFGAQMYQDLMAEQAAQKPSFGERLAADPFFQMGAAILGAPGYGGNFMRAVGQGMSQGLQNAQAAEAARRETTQNQIRNRLWMEQLNNERFRLLGGEQPNAYELGQMEYQRGQIASKMRELDLRERGVYNQATGGTLPQAPAGYKWTPEGNLTFVPGGPADPAVRASLRGESGGKGGKGGKVDSEKIDQALSQIDYMERNLVDPESGAFQEITSDLGGIGRLFQTAAAGLKNIYNQWLPDPSNPSTMTAEVYRRQLSALAGTLAKANGDTGTLSEGDIKRALDAMPQPDAWPDSKQMAKLLIGNLRQVLVEKRQAASAEVGSLPPETGGGLPAASGPTPGDVEDGYRYLGGDPGDPANWEPAQ